MSFTSVKESGGTRAGRNTIDDDTGNRDDDNDGRSDSGSESIPFAVEYDDASPPPPLAFDQSPMCNDDDDDDDERPFDDRDPVGSRIVSSNECVPLRRRMSQYMYNKVPSYRFAVILLRCRNPKQWQTYTALQAYASVFTAQEIGVEFAWYHPWRAEMVLVCSNPPDSSAVERAVSTMSRTTLLQWYSRIVLLPSLTESINFVLWRQCDARALFAEAFLREQFGRELPQIICDARMRVTECNDDAPGLRVFGLSLSVLLQTQGFPADYFERTLTEHLRDGICYFHKPRKYGVIFDSSSTYRARFLTSSNQFDAIANALSERLLQRDGDLHQYVLERNIPVLQGILLSRKDWQDPRGSKVDDNGVGDRITTDQQRQAAGDNGRTPTTDPFASIWLIWCTVAIGAVACEFFRITMMMMMTVQRSAVFE